MNTSTEPTKLTPIYATAQGLGAEFVEVAHWRFAEVYPSVEEESAAARAGCGLADVTPHGKLQIEGASAEAALRAAYGTAPQAIGAGAEIEAGHVYRLRRDQFYLSTPPGGEAEARARLEAAIREGDHFVTVTDVTHGLAELRIIGPASRDVLSQLCGLDFHPVAFPDNTARQSSLAKVRQLLIRRDFGDLPAFSIIGARSLGAYVWDVVLEAGRESGIAPIGVAALRALEES